MDWKVGQLVIYQNGDKVEIGKIKAVRERTAFVYYHSGETAAMTDYEDLKPILNDYCILSTSLGGGVGENTCRLRRKPSSNNRVKETRT